MVARAEVRLEFVDGYVYAMTRELIGFTKRERRSADLSVERAPRVG